MESYTVENDSKKFLSKNMKFPLYYIYNHICLLIVNEIKIIKLNRNLSPVRIELT